MLVLWFLKSYVLELFRGIFFFSVNKIVSFNYREFTCFWGEKKEKSKGMVQDKKHKFLWGGFMAPYSSTLVWKIPWMEEPGRLQSMGSLRVGHDWATSLSLFTFMHWRRIWQSTPVFLPGEPQGRGSLVGCRLWGHTESDTTEVT